MSNKLQFSGFTLIEIMIVLVLVGCLLALIPDWNRSTMKASQHIHELNILMIEEASQLYKIDVGIFPQRVDDLIISPNGSTLWKGPYLEHYPDNPWDKEVIYQIEANGKVSWSR